jgi:hypothetical protein
MPNEPPSCWKTLIALVARDTASSRQPAVGAGHRGNERAADPEPADERRRAEKHDARVGAEVRVREQAGGRQGQPGEDDRPCADPVGQPADEDECDGHPEALGGDQQTGV